MIVTITQEYKPTVQELAQEIWDLDAEGALLLLNELDSIDSPGIIAMQMQFMENMKNKSQLYSRACHFVEHLNDYLNER